jgi:hypothetical protein
VSDDELNFYDLLEMMVARIPWRDENDMKTARALLVKVKDVNLFGYMADITKVDNPRKQPDRGVR